MRNSCDAWLVKLILKIKTENVACSIDRGLNVNISIAMLIFKHRWGLLIIVIIKANHLTAGKTHQ